MPKITKIENQKNEKRANIYIDDEFFLGVDKEIIYMLRLREGKEIERESLQNIINEEMYIKAKNKALKLLHFSSRTEKEMRERLKKYEYEETVIDRVMDFLKEYDFINDQKYTERMIRSKSKGKKYGQNRIKQDLYRKGIHESMIEDTLLEEIDEETEYENAFSLAQKKMRTISDTDKRKIYEKIGRYLAYRGYKYDLIKKVINDVLK